MVSKNGQQIRRVDLKIAAVPLPDSTRAATDKQPDADGRERYTVAVNANMDELQKAAAFIHEALHIYHNGCEQPGTLEEIEAERRAELIGILECLIQQDKAIKAVNDPYSNAWMDEAFYGRRA